MRFHGRPWNGRRYVLEFGMRMCKVFPSAKQEIERMLNMYNRCMLNELEVMAAIVRISKEAYENA